MKFTHTKPRSAKKLPSRRFEELVAELMKGQGFNVELTAPTRDGGFDIVAIKSEPFGLRILLECKRYTEKPVGVEFVRALHGVVQSQNASKGIAVTTSRFTKPAQEFLKQNEWVLEGKDLHGLLSWLELRHKTRVSSATSRIIHPE